MSKAAAGRPLAKGLYGDTRRAWVEVGANSRAVLAVTDPDNAAEVGGDVMLNLVGNNTGKAVFRLTTYTEAELVALYRVIDMAFEMAREVCAARDRAAEEALAEGDTAYVRCFRPTPTFWLREGDDFERNGGAKLPEVPLRREGDDQLINTKSVGKFAKPEPKVDKKAILEEDDSKPYGVG